MQVLDPGPADSFFLPLRAACRISGWPEKATLPRL
jgi:hypothetical protein